MISGSGTLCASWQCLEVPRGPPPSLAVQFVGSGTSLSGVDVELVGSRYRMSLVKKRFATGKNASDQSLQRSTSAFMAFLPSVALRTDGICRTFVAKNKKRCLSSAGKYMAGCSL